MQRSLLATALFLACGLASAAAQTSSSEWTDFWGTVVNYKDGAAPSTNRRLHRHLLQSASANATATVTVPASNDWSNIYNTLLSSNWSSLEPAALQNFNWSQLGDFEVTTPVADLLQEIEAEGVPTTEDQVKADVDEIVNAFCTPDSYTPSKKVSASCSAPTVILALQPHECLLDDSTKEVTCKPAQLVLTKIAGSCQHKSESPVKFTSKSCKVKKTAGFSKYTVQGGEHEIVPVDLSKLTKGDSDDDSSLDGSASAANATATAGK